MNIFNIPSWYPSANNPIYGTFVKEQIEMLAKENPDWNMGITTWGQGDPNHMLWIKDHIKNLPKLLKKRAANYKQFENIYSYHSPTPTWTRKFLNGNINGLIKVCSQHFELFQKQAGKVDVIHAQATYPGSLIAQALSEKHSIPYFVTIRMSPFPFQEFQNASGDLKQWVRKTLASADGLIATSSSLKKKLEEFQLRKVMVINNPVDMDFFHPIDFLPEKLTILTIGRMVPQKGIDLLIKAINLLDESFQGEFRIGGDGEYLDEYRRLAKKLKVDHRITWLGELSREQVRDEMQRCSFYVLPSRHETFGNVILEAMACGKPVLATTCGGPKDIVNEKVGIFTEIDIANIQQSIERFDPKKFDSKSIVDHLKNGFSIGVMAKKLERLIK